MGYQKSPTLSSNNYKKKAVVRGGGGSGNYGGSHGFSSNNYRKNGTVGGFGSSRGHVGSKSMGSTGRSGVLKDSIQKAEKPISSSARLLTPEYEVYIKKEFMFRFEPLFEVGQCYILSNFGIAENSGRLPLLPHRYKISFYKCTTVTLIEPFDNNTNRFILEPFNHLLDSEHHQYYKNDDVDVIGSVVGIGDIVPVMSVAGKKIRRTIVLEDADGNRLDLTFWDTWASMWDPYANKRYAIEHLVYLPFTMPYLGLGFLLIETSQKLQLSKKERDGYEANQVKIELFSPEVKVVSIAEFFHGAINRMVDGIRDSEPDSHYIVYARIHRIHKEHGWAYTTLLAKAATKKFKVIVRVIDNSGSAPLLFFNNNFVKLSGYTAWELIEKYNMDPDKYWPEELDNIVGKKYMHTTSKTRDSTSKEGSSSKKRKLIIDLDDVESEPEEEGNISKTHELVAVKMEPEY
ncbi:replication protein A 70 kDa DNA-binding subunit B [Tanacetum coccineum]